LRQNIVLRPVSLHNRSGKPKPTRTGDPRPRRGRSRCRSEALIAGEPTGARAGWGSGFRFLFGRSKRGHPSARAGGPVGRKEYLGPSGSPPAERLRTAAIRERYVIRPTSCVVSGQWLRVCGILSDQTLLRSTVEAVMGDVPDPRGPSGIRMLVGDVHCSEPGEACNAPS